MTTNDQPTTYAQLTAKVEAAGLQCCRVKPNPYYSLIWGRNCEPHIHQALRGSWDNLVTEECGQGSIDDCIAAVLATEPAPPASVAELVAACEIAKKRTESLQKDLLVAKAIKEDDMVNSRLEAIADDLRAAIAKHEANSPGDAR